MKQKPKNMEKIKANITMVIAFMIFLFAYCYVMYTDVGHKNDIDLNETIEIEGGDDLVSQKLANIIPFSAVTDPSYLTAYQDKMADNSSVNNDVFLFMATKHSQSKSYNSFKDVLERLYGNNLFIVFRSFNVDGKLNCSYDNNASFYQCKEEAYEGITYNANRNIDKLKLMENGYFLEESVIFYSQDNNLNYQVYSDYTYQNVIGTFTNDDLNGITIEDFLTKNYAQFSQKYQSKFGIFNDTYRWLYTERIN